MLLIVIIYGLTFYLGEYISNKAGVPHSVTSLMLAVFLACTYIFYIRLKYGTIFKKVQGKKVFMLPFFLLPLWDIVYLCLHGGSFSFNLFGSVTSVLCGIAEEFAFRGYLLKKLNVLFKQNLILVSAVNGLLFGVFHCINFFSAAADVVLLQALCAAATGFALCAAVFLYESLLPAVCIHAVINFFGSAVNFEKSTTANTVAFMLIAVCNIITGVWMIKLKERNI